MSGRCLRRNGVVVRSLHQRNERTGTWREIAVEDRHSTPGEIAGLRIDFANWLESLSTRDRKVAERLATGETTASAARLFQVSRGRISQLRRQFFESWHKFVGELAEVGTPAVVTF
jgi:DNA-directed RNA polymerase sigma subunit (sigma70/sigma32)